MVGPASAGNKSGYLGNRLTGLLGFNIEYPRLAPKQGVSLCGKA